MVAAQRNAPVPGSDEYLTTGEAGAFLGYSGKTLSNWRSLGIGPRWVKLPNGALRYKRSELARWAKRQGR